MRRSCIMLGLALALVGCANNRQPEEAPVCTGNPLRGCKPVIYFAEGSSQPEWRSAENLAWALNKLNRYPDRNLRIVGHASASGETNRNWGLSRERAFAVKRYFTMHGISDDRMHIAFSGATDPVCTTEECQELNRRVILEIVPADIGWARESVLDIYYKE